jgi:hypothetical protein
MKLAKGIQSGALSTEAFERQLKTYERKKKILVMYKDLYSPEFLEDQTHSLDLSIKMTQLFIDNFNAIKKGLKK